MEEVAEASADAVEASTRASIVITNNSEDRQSVNVYFSKHVSFRKGGSVSGGPLVQKKRQKKNGHSKNRQASNSQNMPVGGTSVP